MWKNGLPVAGVLLGAMALTAAAENVASDAAPEGEPTLQAAVERTPYWYELPLKVRRDLPSATISVHYWNDDADRRFVKVGDLRVAEGEPLAEDFWVREIRRDSVLLEFRGHRFILER